MKKKFKLALYWILAMVITLAAVIYQRRTGPTYDKETEISIENQQYEFQLLRSHGGETDAEIILPVSDEDVTGEIKYRKYPTTEDWTTRVLNRRNDTLTASLPHLPPAGKYEYMVSLKKNGETYQLNNGQPLVIRFKGDVPAGVLVPHIILMFLAMLLGNLAGIMAFFNYPKFRFYTTVTLFTLFIGGLIFGPWVQWHAFGEAWAGVPFAWDLTDNKTLIAFLFWMLAFFMNRTKRRPVYTIIAAIVMLVVYSIPHSMYGSQLDPETGEIIQGWIRIYLI